MLDRFLVEARRFPGTVLVTGAGGCIGSWVIATLVRSGVAVAAFDLTDDKLKASHSHAARGLHGVSATDDNPDAKRTLSRGEPNQQDEDEHDDNDANGRADDGLGECDGGPVPLPSAFAADHEEAPENGRRHLPPSCLTRRKLVLPIGVVVIRLHGRIPR